MKTQEATVYVFVADSDLRAVSALVLGEDGSMTMPLASCTLPQLRDLMTYGPICLVLPATWISVHRVVLPAIPDAKARLAIPYALEDHVAQSLEAVHVAFDRTFHEGQSWIVAVIDRLLMEKILASCKAAEIEVRAITSDWFALQADEILFYKDRVYYHTPHFQGSLAGSMTDFWQPDPAHTYSVQAIAGSPIPDSLSALSEPHIVQEVPEVWIAQRLHAQHYINFCQGRFQAQSADAKPWWWAKAACLTGALWFLGSLLWYAGLGLSYQKKIQPCDAAIAQVYHQFFPQASHVIAPRFRVTQWLKTHQNSQNQTFFLLLDKLSGSMHTDTMHLLALRWQNNRIMLTLKTQDFDILNIFQKNMQARKIHWVQKEAKTQDNAVMSQWELTI